MVILSLLSRAPVRKYIQVCWEGELSIRLRDAFLVKQALVSEQGLHHCFRQMQIKRRFEVPTCVNRPQKFSQCGPVQGVPILKSKSEILGVPQIFAASVFIDARRFRSTVQFGSSFDDLLKSLSAAWEVLGRYTVYCQETITAPFQGFNFCLFFCEHLLNSQEMEINSGCIRVTSTWRQAKKIQSTVGFGSGESSGSGPNLFYLGEGGLVGESFFPKKFHGLRGVMTLTSTRVPPSSSIERWKGCESMIFGWNMSHKKRLFLSWYPIPLFWLINSLINPG